MNAACATLVVGAGPAGLITGLELAQNGYGPVVVVERGEMAGARSCPALDGSACIGCQPCSLLSGEGGSSGLLGGKLCFFPAGSRLSDRTGTSLSDANAALVRHLESMFPQWSSSSCLDRGRHYAFSPVAELEVKEYLSVPVLSPHLSNYFRRLIGEFKKMGGLLLPRSDLVDLSPGNEPYRFVATWKTDGRLVKMAVRDAVVVASGRSGASSTERLFSRIGVRHVADVVDVGLRLQALTDDFRRFLPTLQDPKLKIRAGQPDEVRTLCWCRGGYLTVSNLDGCRLVDGHFGSDLSPFTSVSIVARVPVPSGCRPIEFAREKLGRLVGENSTCHQDLRTFMGLASRRGRASTELADSRSAALSTHLDPAVRGGLLEMLERLDQLSDHRLLNGSAAVLHGPVIDKAWVVPTLDKDLMTNIPGLYVAGDATGLGRGIMQAVFSGFCVASSIVAKSERGRRAEATRWDLPGEKAA